MNRTMMEWKPIQQALGLEADGIPGKNTLKAVVDVLNCQHSWQNVQRTLGTVIDGVPGSNTAQLVADYLGLQAHAFWPRQRDVQKFYGEPGKNLVTVPLPYEMRLAWETSTTVNSLTMHEKVADATRRIFERTLEHYGMDEIRELGLDLNGGAYNRRRIIGSKEWSMHAYGVAFDIDPEHNQYQWGSDKARLARPEYLPFWNIVESEGGVSLGRERNYDWMHIQFARL